MILKFNNPIMVPSNISSINSTIMGIKVKPGLAQDPTKVNLSWNLKSMSTMSMEIDLIFDNPLWLSSTDVIKS